ncbi:uncharacterized protein LOC115629643 [Scaptodrosophila lebanonensis]|uniref:Uncharacterized protein LOC115629643 n=1 Tax=Drosophila lebanonensis TaxID=7225 RepID=A0A6J2U0Y0_DROLE|nr:uncharacterized protein LOC115629643 [Scaptodrosophila lebanonensis]
MTLDKDRPSLCFYTIALLLVWLAVIKLATGAPLNATTIAPPLATTATTATTTTTTENTPFSNPLVEHNHERNCKALCEHCGCIGFYCGEECICECNNENSDTECIRTMQTNAKALEIPYQILIQGPSSNCFVRNALQFDANATDNKARKRRSTITIYKPSLLGQSASNSKRAAYAANALEAVASAKKSELDLARHKRSVDHLEWFNDFASTLVRPAPVGARAAKQREEKAAQVKRQSSADMTSHREPWFLEHSMPRLTRPAPLQRRGQSQDRSSKAAKKPSTGRRVVAKPNVSAETPEPETREIRPLRDALQVVENLPRVFQNTVNSLTSSDSRSGDMFSLNIMNDVIPKAIGRNERPKKPRRQSEKVAETTPAPPIPTQPPPPLPHRNLFLPWLRERRLMRRLQHGLPAVH